MTSFIYQTPPKKVLGANFSVDLSNKNLILKKAKSQNVNFILNVGGKTKEVRSFKPKFFGRQKIFYFVL